VAGNAPDPAPEVLARQLTGAERQQLTAALVGAFPDHDALEEMVSFHLNENLDAIAGGLTLTALVLNLVQWAEAQNRVPDLVAGAQAANPGNSALQAIAAQLARPAAVEGLDRGRAAGPFNTTRALQAGLVAIPVLLIALLLAFGLPGRGSVRPPAATASPGPSPTAPPTATALPPTATPPPATPTPAAAAGCSSAADCFHAGLAAEGASQWHVAIAALTRALAYDPADADAYNALGYAYDRTGDYDGAIRQYQQAITLDGQKPLFYYNRGSTYYRKAQGPDQANPNRRQIDDAQVIADMSQAFALGLTGYNAYAYYFRGTAYQATGDVAHARADLAQARTLCVDTDPGLCQEVDAALKLLPAP